MNTLDQLHSFIEQFISERNPDWEGPLKGDCRWFEEGLIDSMAFIQLISTIESVFSIELDLIDVDPDTFVTVDGFLNTICSSHG